MNWYACSSGLAKFHWLRWTALGIAVSAYSALSTAQVSVADQPPLAGASVHYTQGNFRLPFQVGPGGRCPAMLDLLVSRDAGKTWFIHQSVAPAEQEFQVTEADEGEFLVRVQARDRAASALAPAAMRVVVDRTQPQVNLVCQWQADGRLTLKAHATDPNLDQASAQLEIRTDLQPEFVGLESSSTADRQATELSSTSTIQLAACQSFEVRYSIADFSGNRRVHTERFLHPLATERFDVLPGYDQVANPTNVKSTDGQSIELVADNFQIQIGTPQNEHPSSPAVPVVQMASIRKLVELTPPSVNPSQVVDTASHSIPAGQLPDALPSPPTGQGTSNATSVPRVHSPSQRLQLAYQSGDDCPAPTRVELWCSRNQGQSWEYWGEDADCQSPCRIQVDMDGEYHFRIVPLAEPADMLARPQAGSAADIVVLVETARRPPEIVTLQPIATRSH